MYKIDDQYLIYNAIHILALTFAMWILSKHLMKISTSTVLKSFVIVLNTYVLFIFILVDIKIQSNLFYFTFLLLTALLMSSILSKYIFDIPWLKSTNMMSIFIGLISAGIVLWAII